MGSPAEKGFGQGDPALARWAGEVFAPEDAVLQDVRRRAAGASMPPIHVGPMDGLHLEVLARACGARKAVEIGTLAGLSGICLLREWARRASCTPSRGRRPTLRSRGRASRAPACPGR